MGTYTGTGGKDTITTDEVSAGVISDPAGSRPSDATDRICGLGGDDILNGGSGADAISGGDGNDAIGLHGAGSIVHGDAGNDSINYYTEDDAVFGALYGDDGDDSIELFSYQENGGNPTGTLSLYGGNGNDLISSNGTDNSDNSGLVTYQYGGAGNDRLEATRAYTFSVAYPWNGGDNDDYLFGGPGDDGYFVLEQKDVVIENANEGYDTVEVYWTDYALPANVEKLVANFVAAWNPVFRYDGNDLDNVIVAANGDDTIYGFGGDDTIYGGPCNDTINGGPGADVLYGGANDGVDYGDEDNDKLFGNDGNDRMYGGTGNDELGGQSGNDLMYGGTGNDKLGGGWGSDRLYGEAGDDVLAGRENADRLSGGGGNDVFEYYKTLDSGPGVSNRDVILDFDGIGKTAGDRIDLAKIDADIAKAGDQAFIFKGAGVITGPGQLHVVASGADTLVQANTGGSLAPELEILVKDGTALHTQWVAGDFIL